MSNKCCDFKRFNQRILKKHHDFKKNIRQHSSTGCWKFRYKLNFYIYYDFVILNCNVPQYCSFTIFDKTNACGLGYIFIH